MKVYHVLFAILAVAVLAGELGAQSPFPSTDLGVAGNWQSDLEGRFKTAMKPWTTERKTDATGRPYVIPGKTTALPYAKTVRSSEVVVSFDAGDTFVFTTKLGDSNTDVKKLLREVDPADAVPLLFEIMGADDAVSGCAVAYKLATSNAMNSARAALAWTMRTNLHQREVVSRATSAILGESEPDGGFYAIPNPLSLVDKKKYNEFLDALKKSFDPAMKSASGLMKKKSWSKGIGEIKHIHACFEEIRSGLTDTQVTEYETAVKVYEEASIKVEDVIKEIMSMGSYDRLKAGVGTAKTAIGTDLIFARKVAQAFAFKHDDVAKNQADWLKDGREFRGSLISFGRAFADGPDDDQYGSKGYMRKVLGKMFACRAYQDIMEKIIDSATRNAKEAVKYAPDDPLSIKVDQSAEKLKKDTLKDFNAPASFDNDKTFWVGTGFYRPWSRWYRYW